MPNDAVLVNRAPVLTLWAAIVAERLGYDREVALTLGKAVAGLDAQSKGRRLGIYEEESPSTKTSRAKKAAAPVSKTIQHLGRAVPVVQSPEGLRAIVKDRAESPATVQQYLEKKFGEALPRVEAAMRALAKAHPPKRLEEIAFSLYEEFRPRIPEGVKGWGAKGRLDLGQLREMSRST